MKQILIAILVVVLIAFIMGLLISIVSIKFKVEVDSRLEEVSKLLPGVNCGACGSAGCNAFAEKICAKEADENGCKVIRGEAKAKLQEYIKENF